LAAHTLRSQVRSTVLDHAFTQRLLNTARLLRRRWAALCFARRFSRQAYAVQPAVMPAPSQAADFSESLFRRAVPSRLHEIAQLRVASQVASIPQTRLRAGFCREHGWSGEQVEAAMLGTGGRFTEPERLVLQYAEDITRTPMDIDPQVVRQLRTYFSREELIELTISITHENFRARYAEAQLRLR
jgi:alkylhydroperoxidase family enzyme